ncbi:glycosyltransferase family 4 protein [Brevibacillus sp. SYSU BS000544]|uniref:glycosyltransferase family 4 protein n=1 Tax=Brevibacillus sp. SYSU BS000544 TaxID=3416443 RepID=UPI003CE50026
MKIAIISPGPFTVPPVKGSSVEHDIDEVSKELARNHHVIIYSRKSNAFPHSQQKGNIHYIRVKYKGADDYIRRIADDLTNQNPDVILIENRPLYVPTVRKKMPKTPIILNMHSHVFASSYHISPHKMQKVTKQIDAMITNSEFLRKYYIDEHMINESKVHAVHLGVQLEPYARAAFSPEVGEIRNKFRITHDERVLFFAGRIMKEKGIHLLIKGFRTIAMNDPRARLVIVGGTGYGSNRKNAYVRYLHQLAKPVKNRVTFVNFVPSKKMPIYYQLADVVATPSVWKEAFCRVNLEAMAAGKPVISSTQGGISEVIINEETGILIPVNKWVDDLPEWWRLMWSRKYIQQEMSRRAYLRARQLNWGATAEGYLRVFYSCLT